jgi:predicted outer membrane protein
MRHLLAVSAALVLLAAARGADPDRAEVTAKGKAEGAACHGTAVEFVASPVEAAKLAAEKKKLVFVLHVSGYFEDPQFT